MTAETDRLIDCMARMKGENRPFAVATVVRTADATSVKAGAKAVVRVDGTIEGWMGGGCTQAAIRKAAAEALVDGRARMIRVAPDGSDADDEEIARFENKCPSGGTIEVFIDPVLPRPALLIAGASPTAQALCDLAARAGFAVTVAAVPGDLAAFAQADKRIEGFDLTRAPRAAHGFVVVATQGKRDREAMAAALATGAPYVAFVGSRKKAAALKENLAAAGADPARLAALRAPAGLDIGAATPEEIALSILAEIVRERRLGASAGETATATPAASVIAKGDSACCN